jgi:hypothetical protein
LRLPALRLSKAWLRPPTLSPPTSPETTVGAAAEAVLPS